MSAPGAPDEAAVPRRRVVLARGALLAAWAGAGLPGGRAAFAQPAGSEASAAFEATSCDALWRALGGEPVDHPAVELTAPELAENGAVVPVTATSRIADTTEIALVVDGNPNPLVARFTILPGTEPFVSTRIRMAQSGRVHAVVTAGGRLYGASRHTRVTVGACAGDAT